MDRLIRIIIIAVILGSALWFGLSYGPTPGVRADIYMDLASFYRSVPNLGDKGATERAGVTLLNSNRIYYSMSQSRKPMHEILDDYQNALTPKTFQLFARDRMPNLQEVVKVAPELPFLEFLINQKRVVREESQQWGMVSFLDMGPEANRDWHVVFRRKLEAFSKSGRLGDLGIAKTVVAVPNPTSDLTTVISYWTDPEFNIRDLQDQGQKDLPGKDVANFPRIQPTRRLVTFEQIEDRLGFLLVMYETALSPEQALAAYKAESEKQGWTSRMQEHTEGRSGLVLFLNRGHAEAHVFARREGSKTFVLVNHRILN
jgi:hypothetical protein